MASKTTIATIKSTIDTSNSSNTVLLLLIYTAYRGHFLDRAKLLAYNLLKQGYVSPKSSLQTCYRRDHDLVDRYEISISQLTVDLLLSYVISFFFSSIIANTFIVLDYMYVTRRLSYQKQQLRTLRVHTSSPSHSWWDPCC